jgi:hypothetical protein
MSREPYVVKLNGQKHWYNFLDSLPKAYHYKDYFSQIDKELKKYNARMYSQTVGEMQIWFDSEKDYVYFLLIYS